MKSAKKRLFAAALSLAMLFSLLPVSAFEADAETAEAITGTAEVQDADATASEDATGTDGETNDAGTVSETVTGTAEVEDPDTTASEDATGTADATADTESVADETESAEVLDAGEPTDSPQYVLMNIPYADFYAAELGADDMTADAVTSATLKASNSAIVGGSYHDGESYDILGVTYPVRAESASALAAYRVADSEDALFSGGDYAYVPMSSVPANYKALTLDENGTASFGAVQSGASKEMLSAELNLTVLTRRGDYEITYRDEAAVQAVADSVVLGQILTASDGHKYAMRHLENIWDNIEMALCTGHSDTIKNVNKEDALTPSQSGYAGLEGSTVTGITYYVKNADGEYQTFEVSVNLPIPAYPSASFTDSRTIQLTGLPQADLDTIRAVTQESPENAGTTKERFYAAYVTNQETERPQPLVLTENPIGMEVSDDGAVIIRTEDAAESGERYAVRVIQDRTKRAVPDQLLLINVEAVLSAQGGSETEQPQDTAQYVLMNIPYADFYAAELGDDAAAVDAVTSATRNKPRTGGLAGGSYHVNSDGSDISGVIFPVFVPDMSALDGKTQVTDNSSVSITVTNRGQEATTTYEGRDALFESADYSYYVLSAKPTRYKTLTVTDGAFTFGAVSGRAATVEGVSGEVTVGGIHAYIEFGMTI
ncbi:MAG: hypothetical protein IJQ25_02025, partial [Oscillibacter sp.]|nr:hypothetical protein [Oscillibacter sp.]